jgi:hypothetical protein
MTLATLPPASERIDVTQAAALMERHRETVAKWMRKGAGGVKLYSFKVGHKLYTTRAAIDRFLTETQR